MSACSCPTPIRVERAPGAKRSHASELIFATPHLCVKGSKIQADHARREAPSNPKIGAGDEIFIKIAAFLPMTGQA
jgi:hypothetical protein